MGLFLAFAIIALLGLMVAIRLAPSDPAVWHVDPAQEVSELPAVGGMLLGPGSAVMRLGENAAEARDILDQLAAVARAAPRTELLAGTPEEGRMTWVSRSKYWGFPDYTTAQVTQDGLVIYVRLRFGRSDFGVNGKRLQSWASAL